MILHFLFSFQYFSVDTSLPYGQNPFQRLAAPAAATAAAVAAAKYRSGQAAVVGVTAGPY